MNDTVTYKALFFTVIGMLSAFAILIAVAVTKANQIEANKTNIITVQGDIQVNKTAINDIKVNFADSRTEIKVAIATNKTLLTSVLSQLKEIKNRR